MENKNYRNFEQDRRLDNMEKHLSVVNGELGEIKTHLAKVRTDVCWLKKFFWVVVGTSVASLIAAIFNLIIK